MGWYWLCVSAWFLGHFQSRKINMERGKSCIWFPHPVILNSTRSSLSSGLYKSLYHMSILDRDQPDPILDQAWSMAQLSPAKAKLNCGFLKMSFTTSSVHSTHLVKSFLWTRIIGQWAKLTIRGSSLSWTKAGTVVEVLNRH